MLSGLRVEKKEVESKNDKKKDRRKEQKKRKKEKKKDSKKAKKGKKDNSSSSSSASGGAEAEAGPSQPRPAAGLGLPLPAASASARQASLSPCRQGAEHPASMPPPLTAALACGGDGGGDFFSSLGTEHKKKGARVNSDVAVVSKMELNPLLQGKETDQPTARSVHSIPSHLKVGDGGASWRRRMERRVNQAPEVVTEKKDEIEPGLQWGGSRGKKKNEPVDFMEKQRGMMVAHREELQQIEKLKEQERREAEKQATLEQELQRRRPSSSSRPRSEGGREQSRSRSRRSRGRGSGRDRSRSRDRRSRSRSQSRRKRTGVAAAAGSAGGWRKRAVDRASESGGGETHSAPKAPAADAVDAADEVEAVLRRMRSKYGGGAADAAAHAEPPKAAAAAAAAAEDEDELDANTLGAMAMESMLAGDMETYASLNKRLEKKQADLAAAAGAAGAAARPRAAPQGNRTEVLEEVDGLGRSRAMLESVHTTSTSVQGKRRGEANAIPGEGPAKDSKGQKPAKDAKTPGYYADDNISLDDLVKRERVEGVQDYDRNITDHILHAKKFKQLHDDEDEAYALGWYESHDKKLGAQKGAELQRKKEVRDKQSMKRNLENCDRCMESKKFRAKDALFSASPRAYLCADGQNRCILPGQVFICPQDHVEASTDLDDAAWTEIRNYQKCLVRYWEAQDPPKAVLFTESCVNRVSKDRLLVGGGAHAHVVAYPVDPAIIPEARAYFKKALDEAECEWSAQHKKVIVTSGKGGVRDAIPKNFPYVHVDFNLSGGFAHVVEDASEFPKDFLQHTIAGMCELTVLDRAYHSKEAYWEDVKAMKLRFSASFDWTSAL